MFWQTENCRQVQGSRRDIVNWPQSGCLKAVVYPAIWLER